MYTFTPREARAVYRTDHTSYILYPFAQVLVLAQHSDKGVYSALTLGSFYPSHPGTGPVFDTVNCSVHTRHAAVCILRHFTYFNRSLKFQETHQERGVDLPLLPESQFYLLLRGRVHSGERRSRAVS